MALLGYQASFGDLNHALSMQELREKHARDLDALEQAHSDTMREYLTGIVVLPHCRQ